MELYQIRYFVALCEALNFARAAEQCGVSSPSLTRAVQKLEHELALIRRERRLTHLTDLGRLVRPTACKARKTPDDLRREKKSAIKRRRVRPFLAGGCEHPCRPPSSQDPSVGAGRFCRIGVEASP